MTALRLDSLRVATPCTADWDNMVATPDARVRFCGQCEKNVYNLSEMTRVEAEALVHAREGRMCVRFFRREDGTVLTSDCPDGMRSVRFRGRVFTRFTKLAVSAGFLMGLGMGRARADLAVDRNGNPVPAPPPIIETMGTVAPERPAPKPPKVDKTPAKPQHAKAQVKAAKREKGRHLMGDVAE